MTTAIVNGKVYVERGRFARAVLTRGGVIERVGTDEEVLAGAPDRVIDAGGRTVLPGFNDAHLHLASVGEALSLCDMGGARSVDEVVARGRAFLGAHPEAQRDGLLGFGYNQDYFEGEKRLLERGDLDRISADVPVVIKRVCGHILAANSRAIDVRGIAGDTPQFAGGAFEIGADGKPNGVFKENAMDEILKLFPEPNFARRAEYMRRAMAHAVSMGITSVQSNDAHDGDAVERFRLMKTLEDAGEMKLRYRHQITLTDAGRLRDFLATEARDGWYEGKRVQLGPLKLFRDGSLGARTALLRADYRDDPGNRGVEVISSEQFAELLDIAQTGGMQVIAHAIGDAAIDDTVGNYERVIGAGENRLRHGVVHYQITDEGLHARMARRGILALVQPIFLNYDLHIVESRVGRELASSSYAFGTLARMGAPVAYGTDAPVESLNPFPCVYCAVTRRDLEGSPAGGFNPGERVDVCEAIDRYTVGSAYAEFQEGKKGRIAPGCLADLVIIDRDIFAVPVEEIPHIRAELTMVGGDVVFERQ